MSTGGAGSQTLVVGDVWVDVVLHQYTHDVVATHLTRVAERRTSRGVLQVHLSTFAQQQLKRFTAGLLFLHSNA